MIDHSLTQTNLNEKRSYLHLYSFMVSLRNFTYVSIDTFIQNRGEIYFA